MPKVFVVNEPLRRNHESGELERFLPIHLAAQFGDVVKLTPDGAPPANLASVLKNMVEDLKGFREAEDYLVCVGNQPLLIAAAAMVGANIKGGRLRVLQWDARDGAYAPITLRIGE